MMIKLNVEKVTKKMGWYPGNPSLCGIRRKICRRQYDIVLCSKNFVSMFADAEKRGTKIVGLKNVMSAKEIEEGLAAAINK